MHPCMAPMALCYIAWMGVIDMTRLAHSKRKGAHGDNMGVDSFTKESNVPTVPAVPAARMQHTHKACSKSLTTGKL